jgi:hypothetical protein
VLLVAEKPDFLLIPRRSKHRGHPYLFTCWSIRAFR